MRANTDWFRDSGWGVFCHYLISLDTPTDAWNAQVDGFDVHALAQQLDSVGAPTFFITLGQNSGHYCAPNPVYDELVGIHPSKCSQRDLVADLYAALQPRGIRLMVYLPSGAPSQDPVAMARLDWRWGFERAWPWFGGAQTGERLAAFQLRWEAVIREWSQRWGDRVSGWWFDGCYFADAMYRHPDPPNFSSLAAAAKAGNANSLVAFNPGVLTPVISLTEHEDYTAGEIADAFPVCPGRWVNGAQFHVLSYLGENWSRGELRFPDEFVSGYTQHVVERGGVVTWDVPISAAGEIPTAYLDQLAALRGLRGSRKSD